MRHLIYTDRRLTDSDEIVSSQGLSARHFGSSIDTTIYKLTAGNTHQQGIRSNALAIFPFVLLVTTGFVGTCHATLPAKAHLLGIRHKSHHSKARGSLIVSKEQGGESAM